MKRVVLLFLAFLIAACASLASPDTIRGKIAYAYASVAASEQSAAQLLAANRLNAQEAQKVADAAQQIHVALAAAELASGTGDLKTAEDQLRFANQILLELNRQLTEKSK